MFFSKPGEYNACGCFTIGHFIMFFFTIIIIAIGLKRSKKNSKEEIYNKIKNIIIIICLLESIKIIFNISKCGVNNLNTYIPLYYCSIFLYAGILSTFGKGKIKRVGDVFLATGSIAGGIAFLVYPVTSLYTYQMFHFISIYSFFYHGVMIYIGVLVNITKYIQLKKKDIVYYATLVLIVCIIALIINIKYNCNLMFISNDFGGTPISYMHKITGKYFTISMILSQMTIPYIVVYNILKKLRINL